MGGSGEPCRILSDVINEEREGHLHIMQDNTKNRAALVEPMPAFNAGGMDGETKMGNTRS